MKNILVMIILVTALAACGPTPPPPFPKGSCVSHILDNDREAVVVDLNTYHEYAYVRFGVDEDVKKFSYAELEKC